MEFTIKPRRSLIVMHSMKQVRQLKRFGIDWPAIARRRYDGTVHG
ncbi:hypothetical protein [Lactiplantibacillus carotarum]|nr:hypothetical protein [Lactiplantibacillus carotarum]